MACGTPVIVSNVGGMPETIISKEYGTILKERNIETIQDAIRILIERSSGLDVEKMHADICAEFSITVAADRYLSIYKDLLE
jgi:glycosyltransferase involved in cell wall biosynthesis